MVASYNVPVQTVDEAPSYILADVAILTKILEDLPCKHCLNINCKVIVTQVYRFTQKISIHCNSCKETKSFCTSQRLDHNENGSGRKNAFDVNRRLVKSFASLGKGHMALQTFSMCMKMPCLHHSAFDKHFKELVVVSTVCANKCLQNARVEVEKAFIEIETILTFSNDSTYTTQCALDVVKDMLKYKLTQANPHLPYMQKRLRVIKLYLLRLMAAE